MNHSLKRTTEALPPPGPNKKLRFLDCDSDDADSDNDHTVDQLVLKVNEQFAKRYQYNKEREERQRLEEKYGKSGQQDSSSEDEEDEEDEDDYGELASEALDAEISATLQAIRSRDPRIYEENTVFYSQTSNPTPTDTSRPENPKEKPMYLRDYHRKNLLENAAGGIVDDDNPLPYSLEQEKLKKSLTDAFHKENVLDSDQEDFLVRKPTKHAALPANGASFARLPDPTTADDNPEAFLSDYLTSRAWIPTDKSQFKPLESDDEEEQNLAEQFEYAYNLRFEDPETTNKTITTHSRDIIAKYSVRRNELSARQKARQREKQRKEDQKQTRHEEKKRLKSLRVMEMEAKFQKIKDAAGLHGASVDIADWTDLLEADWDDAKWGEQMRARFDNTYYDQKGDTIDEEMTEADAKPEKIHKPRWDDDIDITDIVPDFEDCPNLDKKKNKKNKNKPPTEDDDESAKAAAKRDRRVIEALAEQSLPLDASAGAGGAAPFRYRATSPSTYGLNALDILAADDSQLNQFVGLKKLAAFRDPVRKRMDKKRLGKKARLRAWRKETFGTEDGPDEKMLFRPAEEEKVEEGEQKKRKRKSKKKTADVAVEA